jgi:hypothetical protein
MICPSCHNKMKLDQTWACSCGARLPVEPPPTDYYPGQFASIRDVREPREPKTHRVYPPRTGLCAICGDPLPNIGKGGSSLLTCPINTLDENGDIKRCNHLYRAQKKRESNARGRLKAMGKYVAPLADDLRSMNGRPRIFTECFCGAPAMERKRTCGDPRHETIWWRISGWEQKWKKKIRAGLLT